MFNSTIVHVTPLKRRFGRPFSLCIATRAGEINNSHTVTVTLLALRALSHPCYLRTWAAQYYQINPSALKTFPYKKAFLPSPRLQINQAMSFRSEGRPLASTRPTDRRRLRISSKWQQCARIKGGAAPIGGAVCEGGGNFTGRGKVRRKALKEERPHRCFHRQQQQWGSRGL